MTQAPDVFYWLPCSVVFVSTAHEGERDIMTATAMFVSEKEPLITISVAKDHLTEKLINQSGKFTLVIAGEGHRNLAIQVGSTKGDVTDKLAKFSIATLDETFGNAPIPEGAAAWMVCDVESSQDIKGYRIFIGRVAARHDTGKPPLVWQKDEFFGLKPI
jgi:flavin reductase (DIM6/NTAB) family NADH-FMN oxidoreductase RutF